MVLGLGIMEGAVQLMRHESLSSKIQTASADVARRMWMSSRGAVKSSCIGCQLNMGLQWLRAAPGRATQCETNDWRSAINYLRERRGSAGKGNSAVVAFSASFIGRRHSNAIVGTTQKRIRTLSHRLCSLWASNSDSNHNYPSICPSCGNFA